MRKLAVGFVVVCLLGYALLVGAVFVMQRSLLFPGARAEVIADPPPWGDLVRISTPDGETLAALRTAAAPGKPTFLFFPGNGDDIGRYGFLARALSVQGYGLLAVSYRGYPGSTGAPSEAGLLIDGIAAFDWLRDQDAGGIVILGRSLGTGVAIDTGGAREALAVVLVSAPLSIEAMAIRRFPYLPVRLLIRDGFRSDLRISAVDEPKLFLHGDADGVVPLESGKALFEIATAPKLFAVLHGRGHNDVWSPDAVAEILTFTNKVLTGEPLD